MDFLQWLSANALNENVVGLIICIFLLFIGILGGIYKLILALFAHRERMIQLRIKELELKVELGKQGRGAGPRDERWSTSTPPSSYEAGYQQQVME